MSLSREQFGLRVRKQARRILAGTVRGSDKRILPGFWCPEAGEPPSWWKDELCRPEWGPLIGVHALGPSARGAVVVTEAGLALYATSAEPSWLPYESMRGWKALSKEPPSKTLTLRTSSGEDLDLPFPRGGAFAFAQFVTYVAQQLAMTARTS